MSTNELSDKFVIRQILPDLLLDPFAIVKRVVNAGGYAKEVRPKMVMMATLTRVVGKKLINQR